MNEAIKNNTHSLLRNRFENNMKFMRTQYADIYSYYKNYSPKKSVLKIYESGNVDIIYNNQSLYNGDAYAYIENEVDNFLNHHILGSTITNVKSAQSSLYKNKRLFSISVNSLLSDIEKFSNDEEKPNYDHDKRIKIQDCYPGLMVFGVGLGRHIEEILNRVDVVNLIIIEQDPDLFYFSLLFVDWVSIFKRYDAKPGSSIKFIVTKKYDLKQLDSLVWNYIVKNYPIYPITHLFYNHLNDQGVQSVLNSVQKRYSVELASWGNYDDECNQINHSLINIQQINHSKPIKSIPDPKLIREPFDGNQPVCIIGSGPSLDKNINLLKIISDKVMLISCGSAITALHKNNIIPDIHCELESDYKVTVGTYESIKDRDYLKSISLVAPLQINPYVCEYFKQTFFFNREGSSVSALFKDDVVELPYASPTCTNVGVALAQFYGCKKICLFGMDFGFRDKKQHHSSSSVYYNKNADPSLVEANDRVSNNLFKLSDINNDPIWSRTDFLYANWRIQASIDYYSNIYSSKDSNLIQTLFNFSDGVPIKGTISCNDQLVVAQEKMKNLKINNILDLEKYFDLYSPTLSIKNNKIKNTTINEIKDLSEKNIQLLSTPITTAEQLYICGNRITEFLEFYFFPKYPAVYCLLIGSIKQFLYVGFTHGLYYLSGSCEFIKVINHWRLKYIQFLKLVPIHFEKRLTRHHDCKTDLTLKMSISDLISIDEEILNGNY